MTIKIGVDIGHGSNTYPPSKGFSKGGVDYHEHNHNSLLGKEVKRLLEVNGFDVFMAQKPNKPEVSLQQRGRMYAARSEEHTSELQSRGHLVCRLLLEKK